MSTAIRGSVGTLVYLLVALGPLFFMLVGDAPPSRGWLVDLSVGMGFVGLVMMGLQFAISARCNAVDASYGLDVVLRFHRQIAFVATGFVLSHPVLLAERLPARQDRTETALSLTGDVDRGRDLFVDTDGGPPIEALELTPRDTIVSLVEGTGPVHDGHDDEHKLSNQPLADLAALLQEADDEASG